MLCIYENAHIHRKFCIIFFLGVMPLLSLKVPETVCHRDSSETGQRNFVKLCSYKGHTVYVYTLTGNSDLIIF